MPLVRACLALSFLLVTGLASADQLVEGSPAPPIKVAKWVKGTPVKTFLPGKVYVVEFWATWCGPCLQSIPHLTELAKTYTGKATFVGVNVWDQGDAGYVDRIEKWVANKKDMAYNVCVDDSDAIMASTWMKAANQNGIPTAFVVDQKGTIAWIGHPMAGLDNVLSKVIAGTWTLAEGKRLRDEATAKQKAFNEAYLQAGNLVKQGHLEEAWAKLDELAAQDPDFKLGLPVIKFTMLAESNEAKAYDLARALLKNPTKENAFVLAEIGQDISLGYVTLKTPDFALAISLVQTAMKLQGTENPFYLLAEAEANFKLGKKAEALTIIERAIDILEKDPSANPKQVEMLEKKRAAYKG